MIPRLYNGERAYTMNLLMISLHADPTSPAGIGEGGGTHSYVRELLTYFATKDISILLISRKSNPDLPEDETISENCRIKRIIIKDENPIDKKELYVLHDISLHKTETVLNKLKYKPDLIHSIYWNSGQVARELSMKLNIPFVHTVISNGLKRQEAGMQEILEQRFKSEKEVFQSASYIFCITPSERRDLIELYQIDAKKIMIPGRPISKDFLYPAHDDFGMPYRFAINKNDINNKSLSKLEYPFKYNNDYTNKWWRKQAFLYCGRIAPNKGIDIVLKAWYQLKTIYSDLCPALWIVGGNPDEINTFKNKLGSQYSFDYFEENGDLIWWGYLDQRGISTLMLKSHALIMHSSYEPGGRVIIEALAAGIPVIATYCGFGMDYIHNWYNGFQVLFGDIEILCRTMSLFIKQPYLSNCLGLNAKKYMQKIIHEWDFYKAHQLVYSVAARNVDEDFQNSGLIDQCENYKNYINVYPYFNDIISGDNLKIQLEAIFHKRDLQIIPIFTETSAVWIIQSSSTEYEAWQPYTRLLDTSYIYTFFETTVDKRSSQYEREKYASSLNINPVLKYIDCYYIYIKNRYPALNGLQLCEEPFQIAVKNLFNIFCRNNSDNIKAILQSFNHDWHNSCIDKIRNFYDKYFEQVPSFLYHSYNINYGLSVRQLYLMLTSQYSKFPEELLVLYFECEDFLKINIDKYAIPYGICLEDCSIENIIYDEVHTECMFRNMSTLYWGDTSRMLAHFLHSYVVFLTKNNRKVDSLDQYLSIFGSISIQNKKLYICWFLIILFEKLIFYHNTLENEKYKMELKILTELKDIYVTPKLPKF